MRSPFERLPEPSIAATIADQWGLTMSELRYLPVGAGAYHWIATTPDGERFFVTCDDLDTKPWLGSDREAVFHGLLDAYTTASHLRTGGLEFVVAPIVTASGAMAARIDDRHSLSVFEHVDGAPGQWGQALDGDARAELIAMLARLHRTPLDAHPIVERSFAVPGRDDLEAAMVGSRQRWTGGPLSEAARHELVIHRNLVISLLDALDRCRAATTDVRLVVTHGEPHPGNLIRTARGLVMVDWDTVALAQPERDLWMLSDDESLIETYERMTQVSVDRAALAAHRLMWSLTDLAAYTRELRGEHQAGADADRALAAVRSILGGEQPTPYGRLNPQACPD